MLGRPSLIFAFIVLTTTQELALASPITYDFAGSLGTPMYGANTFNGSFTFNANPTVSPGTDEVTEQGSDVSLSVDIGGHVFHFANDPQNPDVSAILLANELPTWAEVPAGTPEIGFSVNGYSSQFRFGLQFYIPGYAQQLSNMQSLNFPSYIGSTVAGVDGRITSIEAVSTPEPSTMIVFAALGIGALIHQRL